MTTDRYNKLYSPADQEAYKNIFGPIFDKFELGLTEGEKAYLLEGIHYAAANLVNVSNLMHMQQVHMLTNQLQLITKSYSEAEALEWIKNNAPGVCRYVENLLKTSAENHAILENVQNEYLTEHNPQI